ncbi:MAG: DUF4329 domain-containing protein [Prevotella sp.]|nr:DUF4329 domain-containing protein [Prevotella sp.]
MIDGGYIEGGVYYYYVNDHLGNNRVVVNANGTVTQKNHYYPFGMSFADSYDNGTDQPYKYNGKELDKMHGLNMYDYSARHLALDIPRFTTIDPHAEKYYSWSPYVYCFNNPIRLIDKNGRDPGDPFESPAEAAKDFALYYNGTSVAWNKEFASTIYIIDNTSEVSTYTYTVAYIGDRLSSNVSSPENGETEIAIAHTHGALERLVPDQYEANNVFSTQDKKLADNLEQDNYVATPSGELKKYDHKTKEVTNIKIDNIPSDPADSKRINNIDAKERTNIKYIDPNEKKQDENK